MRATAVDALQHGYRPIVPREAVGDRNPAAHEANLYDIDAKYGDVVSLAEVGVAPAAISQGRFARETLGSCSAQRRPRGGRAETAPAPTRLVNGSTPSRYSSTRSSGFDVPELRVDVEQVPLDDARHPVAHGFAHDDRPEALGDRVLDRVADAAGHRHARDDHRVDARAR